jgi:hypothetical protein
MAEELTMESLAERVSALEAENGELRASLKAQKGQATRARNVAAALREEANPTPRKIGPLPAPKSEEEAVSRREALAAALAGDFVDVVASDGKREIVGLAPQRVSGDAWQARAGGFLLAMPAIHDGADLDKPEVIVRGYGLFDAAGDQVPVYCEAREPIRVGKGQRTKVENTIIF